MILNFRRRGLAGAILFNGFCAAAGAAGVGDVRIHFDVDARPLRDAVRELGSQAGLEVLWLEGLSGESTVVAGLHETLTAEEAFARVLKGFSIRYTFVEPNVYTFQASAAAMPSSEGATNEAAPASNVDPQTTEIPRVLVRGARSLDADVQRTADDARPVLVIDHNRIARSAARNVIDLLRSELPAIEPPVIPTGSNVLTGEADQIDLRGMGSAQTLILIDGRRFAGRAFGADARQPDLAAIPFESIERIEVLPATASARFGGGPGAGVINIVLNRNSPGSRVSVRAGQGPHANADLRQFWGEHVHAFDEGRGRVSISATLSRQEALALQDWNSLTPGREKRAQNDPGFVQSMTVPPLGQQANVRTVDGSPILPGGVAPNLFIPPGYQQSQGLDPLKATEGKYDFRVARSGQVQGGGYASVRPGVDVKAATITAGWDFSSIFSADLDLAYGRTTRTATASGADYAISPGILIRGTDPKNPFGKDVYVTAPFASGDALMQSEDRTGHAMVGLGARLPHEWAARFEYMRSSSALTLSRPVLQGDGDPIAHGLDLLSDPIREEAAGLHASTLTTTPVRSMTESVSLLFAGSLLQLPAGAASLTLRVERRRDWLAQGSAIETLVAASGGTPLVQDIIPEQRAVTDSGHAELALPLISRRTSASNEPFLEADFSVHSDRVRISAAAEDDPIAQTSIRSTSRFGAQSWMAALALRPADFFLVRGSCGTGFVAPPMSELTEPVTRTINFPLLIDPLTGAPVTSFDVTAGGNPQLRPERSRSCSGGVVIDIAGSHALRFSADYTSASKDDVVFVPATTLFTEPAAFATLFPDSIVRAPDGHIISIDGSARNLSHQRIHAWDFALDTAVESAGIGTFGLSLRATLQSVFALQLTPQAPLVNDAGIGPLAPPLWKLNATFTYERGPWTLGWSTRYVPHYRVSRDLDVIRGQGDSHVPGQGYSDFFGRYTLHARGRETPTFHVQIGIRNVFKRTPPFDVTASDYASRQGAGELPAYNLSVGADF